VRITFDPAKRDWTLRERGLDFADAAEVFAGPVITRLDDREDYGEDRYQTFGYLRGRLVMVVWTPRGEDRHVFSMRKANDREQARIGQRLGEGGRDDR
jgi:uncharacterized DUF497 family protein